MRNALNIQPRCWFPRPYSELICRPAMEIFVRSRKEMALRMKSRNARKNLFRVGRSASIRSLLLRTRAPKQRPQEMIPHGAQKHAKVLTYDFVCGGVTCASQLARTLSAAPYWVPSEW